jgi:Flp pilus assembly protein TadD
MAARKSTEVFPSTSASWGNLAMALNQLGRNDEAREAIQHAIELDPNDPRNREILGMIGKTPPSPATEGPR